jgi:DNA-directed RNA polymerase specialized sigma24 family protein
MKLIMVYREGVKFGTKDYEISDEEASEWIEGDYEQRFNAASDEEKKNVTRRSPQEIADEHNRQEERENKAYMRSRAKTASATVLDSDGEEVRRVDLIPDTNIPSPEEACLAAEEQEERKQELQRRKDILYAKLTKIQLRRFEMQLEGMTISQIAEIEGVKYNSIKDSFDLIKAKIEKLFPKVPQKGPENVHYSVGEKNN